MTASNATSIRVVDLTGPITPGMWDYGALGLPGLTLPPVAVDPITTLAKDGYSIHALRLTSLTGAYVETPAHMVADAPLLGDLSMAQLIRPATIMRLPPAGPCTLYRTEDFEAHNPGIPPGDALIIDTGWGRRWNAPDYLKMFPAFAAESIDWFVDQPCAILATDTPVAECLWWDHVDPPMTSEKDKAMLQDLYQRRPKDLILVAPLVNLDKIQSTQGTLVALPINTPMTPAAPCRVVFLEGVRLTGLPGAA